LTALDICAHEFGHGIDQHESNLTYQNESGALDEGLADIWGAVIENWAASEKDHWLIGEEIGGPLRSMSNPSSLTYNLGAGATGTYPDTYNGIGYYTGSLDAGGVHINSSVLNFWFFLLSDGGAGTNDNGNAYSVLGIGINSAARIVYRTETNYLTSSSTFASGRTGSIQAAIDLFGANSCEVIAVTNAWYAVGVGAAYRYPYNIMFSDAVCAGGSSFTLRSVPPGASVTWQATPSNLFVTSSGSFTGSSSGNNSITLTAANALVRGQATLTFTVNT